MLGKWIALVFIVPEAQPNIIDLHGNIFFDSGSGKITGSAHHERLKAKTPAG